MMDKLSCKYIYKHQDKGAILPSIRDIKRKILDLGPADFQEFCDTFLYKKGYENIVGYGMKAGTGKTTKGNPDTYSRNENGKYTFVAYTMQDQGVYPKIKEDIEKCLDVSKTGVEPKNIEERRFRNDKARTCSYYGSVLCLEAGIAKCSGTRSKGP